MLPTETFLNILRSVVIAPPSQHPNLPGSVLHSTCASFCDGIKIRYVKLKLVCTDCWMKSEKGRFPDVLRPSPSEADRLPQDSEPPVDPFSLSPDLRDPADFSPKSPLSCADSLCGRSSDYEDFWSPPSPSASPGTSTQHARNIRP